MDKIQPLVPADARIFTAFLDSIRSDSGNQGIFFHPYGVDEPFDVDAVTQRNAERWARPMGHVGWQRAWGWFRDTRCVGQIHLTGGDVRSALHRVNMGMSIHPDHRRQGGGRRLLQVAVTWARAQPQIDWIDLGVFGGNDPAIALYRAFGFVEVGRTPDRFRVDGIALEDIAMCLSVAQG
ncbi:MAG: GNAT family N-acetyltransferase [Myxococcota bacterium]